MEPRLGTSRQLRHCKVVVNHGWKKFGGIAIKYLGLYLTEIIVTNCWRRGGQGLIKDSVELLW